MKKPERNDPCPCGSGKKYKRCCMASDAKQYERAGLHYITTDITEEISDREFGSLAELQAELDEISRGRNRTPLEDFCGLSPEQMHRILHFPFDSPEIVSFSDICQVPPETPVLVLFSLLANGCGDRGLKATAKGFLPQLFCQQAATTFWSNDEHDKKIPRFKIRKELDFGELHVVRIVAQTAGLLRKYRGRFMLTKKCRHLLSAPENGRIYLELFKAHTRSFNWAYRDLYEEAGIIQLSFLFSLFLLHEFGDDFRQPSFYEDKFMQAFPTAVREIPYPHYRTREEHIGACYSLRTMERFAHFFGLIEIRNHSDYLFRRDYEIRKRPLLDEFVSFNV